MKKKSPLLRIIYFITDPIVIAFVFFWGTLGQFIIPLLYLGSIPVFLSIFAPNTKIVLEIRQSLGKELFVFVQAVILIYFLSDVFLIFLKEKPIKVIKSILKKVLLATFIWFIIWSIFAFFGRPIF